VPIQRWGRLPGDIDPQLPADIDPQRFEGLTPPPWTQGYLVPQPR
jgi:hypothetical protein